MSRLIPNTTPAERAVGCSFGETMESSAKVIANGGEIFGTPPIDFGATLNGTTDYIKYNLQGHEFNSPEISIVMEFWPDFHYTEDALVWFYDGSISSAYKYTIYKQANKNNNFLAIYLGSGYVMGSVVSEYGPYWLEGERNTIQLTGTSGDLNFYFNGHKVTSSTAALNITKPDSFVVGARSSGSGKFKGKIGQLKVFNSLLTKQDAINYYNNSTYSYPNDALLHLPMRACEHDPDNVRTLDVSGNNTHGTLVGSPVKQQKRGYLFDGVDDEFTGLPTLTGDYTVSLLADNEVTSYNNDTVYESLKTPGGFSGVVQNLMVTPYILTPLQEADNRIQMQKQLNHV